MSEREARFKYRLEPLISLRSAERDALQEEMRRAAGEVERRTHECEDLSREIASAEGALRNALRSGASIAIDEQMRLQSYLDGRRRAREAKQRELEAASLEMHRVLDRLTAKQRDAKALEKHRDRKRRQFDLEQSRLALKAADDQWLRRKRDE
jgi:flagellar export protein FliJ